MMSPQWTAPDANSIENVCAIIKLKCVERKHIQAQFETACY